MSKDSRAGVSAIDVLGIVFIVLKLCKVIDWSWWWVLSPIWIVLAFRIIMTIVLLLLDKNYPWWRWKL